MPQAAATTVRMMMGVLALERELEAADEADMTTYGSRAQSRAQRSQSCVGHTDPHRRVLDGVLIVLEVLSLFMSIVKSVVC